MDRSARRAILLVQVGTVSLACGCATAKKTVRTEQMNSSVVSQQILPLMEEPLRNKLKLYFVFQLADLHEVFGSPKQHCRCLEGYLFSINKKDLFVVMFLSFK